MAYTNWRVSPIASSVNPFTIPGTTRRYIGTVGGFLDVPDFDAAQLIHAGWMRLDGGGVTAGAGVGPTTTRPVGAAKGVRFLDTTVGATVVSDGFGNWLHHVTGASS